MLNKQEELELSELEKEFGPSDTEDTHQLSPVEQMELAALEKEFGTGAGDMLLNDSSDVQTPATDPNLQGMPESPQIEAQELSTPFSSEAMSMFDQAIEQEELFIRDDSTKKLMSQLQEKLGPESTLSQLINRTIEKTTHFMGVAPDRLWAQYYNAEYTDEKGIESKAKQYRNAQKIKVLASTKKAITGAIESGAFDAEISSLSVSPVFLQEALENVSKVETSGGRNNTISSGMAGGILQVIPSTFKFLITSGVVGNKSLKYLGKTKEDLLGMGNEEIAEYLRDNNKAGGLFGLAAFINKLQTVRNINKNVQ